MKSGTRPRRLFSASSLSLVVPRPIHYIADMLIRTPIRALGHVDCRSLAALATAAPEAAWFDDVRRQTDYDVHAETQSIILRFCTGWPAVSVANGPGWEPFAAAAMPIMQAIIGQHYPEGGVILRAMLARLRPGCRIPRHQDAHPSFAICHRIHVPLSTNDEVEFVVGRYRVPPRQNDAFELNNAMPHQVANNGTTTRIHFIFDYAPRTG